MDAVCEAIGAAESYKVSVSCVGSDWSLHVRESVPAPQSQKNLQHKHSIKPTVKSAAWGQQLGFKMSMTL